MEHSEVSVPVEVERELARAVGKIHQRLKKRVDETSEVDVEEIKREIDRAVQKDLIDWRIQQAIDQALQEERIRCKMEKEVPKAAVENIRQELGVDAQKEFIDQYMERVIEEEMNALNEDRGESDQN